MSYGAYMDWIRKIGQNCEWVIVKKSYFYS